jgi:aminoglycoside/choline kinase family phosphotransferase
MAEVLQDIRAFFRDWKNQDADEIITLKQAGSNRTYFRAMQGKHSYIITYNPSNIPENNAFIEFSRHFYSKQLPVPEILTTSPDKKVYAQSDFGDISLFDIMKKEGFSDRVFELFKKSCAQLARLQILGGQNLDYNNCIATKSYTIS